MALRSFPMWKECLRSLAGFVDVVYLRFDMRTGDRSILAQAEDACCGKFGGVLKSHLIWDNHNWREELLRMLDSDEPDLVFFPDEDEMFDFSVEEDIKQFMLSDKKEMFFDYDTILPRTRPEVPKRKGKPYPCGAHMKIFKWQPELTYIPYKKRARLNTYYGVEPFLAKSKIQHYHFYTEELYDKWCNRLYNQDKIDENAEITGLK